MVLSLEEKEVYSVKWGERNIWGLYQYLQMKEVNTKVDVGSGIKKNGVQVHKTRFNHPRQGW